MLEVLKYVFSSFWVWSGSMLLLMVATQIFTGLITINYGKKDYLMKWKQKNDE